MTPEQILTTIQNSPALQSLLPDVQAIATNISANNYVTVPKMISHRGVRSLLGPVLGSKFMSLLKSLSAANAAESVPPWLAGVLTALGVPVQDHVYYLDTFAAGYEGVMAEGGILLSDPTTVAMLDIIAAGNPDLQPAVNALKNSTRQLSPVSEYEVRVAIFNDDGSLKV
jgi:hypothetical protein